MQLGQRPLDLTCRHRWQRRHTWPISSPPWLVQIAVLYAAITGDVHTADAPRPAVPCRTRLQELRLPVQTL